SDVQDFWQADTTSVLLTCGGAFTGLAEVSEGRIGQRQLGFGADIKKREEKDIGDLLREVQPEDLLRYGLIPEFVGRLPVVATLHNLDEDALVKILTEPKNALVKQYRKLFDLDGVQLKFSDEALRTVAQRAIKQRAGARGLRTILENAMLETMYEIPGD